VELTAHSTGFSVTPGTVFCGPRLTEALYSDHENHLDADDVFQAAEALQTSRHVTGELYAKAAVRSGTLRKVEDGLRLVLNL
jgi:hypothetical protein